MVCDKAMVIGILPNSELSFITRAVLTLKNIIMTKYLKFINRPSYDIQKLAVSTWLVRTILLEDISTYQVAK